VAYLQAADVSPCSRLRAICAALVRRGRNGRGAYLDVSMLECLWRRTTSLRRAAERRKVQREPRIGMVVHAIGGVTWRCKAPARRTVVALVT